VKRLRKPLLIGAGALLVALAAFAFEVARFSGVFRSIESSFAGQCVSLPLGASSEDIQIDSERGIAYLSYLDRAMQPAGATPAGTVMLLDLNVAEPAARAAMAYDPENFRPGGISLWKRGAQPARLFAISHRPDGTHTVEIAAQSTDGEFFPVETIRNAAFAHPDAIAAVGPRQFYVANDSGASSSFDRVVERLFRRGLSTLVYFDGTEARIADAGLRYPAGLALSPDTTRLYVAEMLGKSLRVYRRDLATGALTLDEVVPLDTPPDNLNVDADGVLWIAAHPKLLAFHAQMSDPSKRTATQVLRFDPREPRPVDGAPDTRLTQIYLNAGDAISAGTVAAHWRDEFLVGSYFEPKVLICKPNR